MVSLMLEGMTEQRKTKTKLRGTNNEEYRMQIIFWDKNTSVGKRKLENVSAK